jgi:hypothetical protein
MSNTTFLQESTGVLNFANETKILIGADILVSSTDFIGHMVLIHRCYYVWGQNKYIIVVPFLTVVAGGACGVEALRLLLSIDPSAPMAPKAMVPLGIATYTLPLCTNVIVTALIAGRIWYHAYGFSEARTPSGSVRRAMIVILESGVVYLVTQLIFVVIFAIRHPAQGIVVVIAVQIYGIIPTLIIIGVELGISSDEMRTTACTSDIVRNTTGFSRHRTYPHSSLALTAGDTDISLENIKGLSPV